MSQPSSSSPTLRPTLASVAERAGVTVPTASKALNQRSDVSDATRRRVLAAADELGYAKPRETVEPVRRSGAVHLVGRGLYGTWLTLALAGAERAAREHGLDLVVTVDEPGLDGRDWVDRVLARPSDGVLLALLQPDAEQRSRLAAAGVRWVLLDPSRTPAAPVPSVGAANWNGGHAAGLHLAELGHRQLGVLAGRSGDLFSTARIDGFRSALAQHGVELPTAAVRDGGWRRSTAIPVAAALLAEQRPTAVFACSDRMALGVLEAARGAGLAVPSDLSVVGFDDLPEAGWSSPPLTTVAQPVDAMAAEALRLLLRLRDGEPTLTGRVELPTRLTLRSSTAPPREREQ